MVSNLAIFFLLRTIWDMPTHKPVKQTLKQIRATAEQLERTALRLRSEADAAQAAGIPELMVTNFDQIDRAMDYAAKYVAAVETAIRQEQRRRGDFKGGSSEAVSDASAIKAKKPGTKRHRSGHPTHKSDIEKSH